MTTAARPARLLVVLVVLGVLVGAAIAGVNTFLRPSASQDAGGDTVTVEVPEGATASSVGDLLAAEGVVSNSWVFRLQARFDDRASRIRPGTYDIARDATTGDILEQLSAVPEAAPTFTVTIPEGLRVSETLQRIADAPDSPFRRRQLRRALSMVALPAGVPQDLPDGAEPFEGLLFPSTYEFRRDAPAAEVLARLVTETEAVLDAVDPPEGLDRYEVLTLASLIEREARLRDEQPQISSVIANRLEEGMPLQIDATVLYALGEQKDRVLLSDLEVDSPWNTYRVQGLPPTPISGAGRGAIEAAASPADTDFLYYVVIDPETGEHGFSASYEEFLENKRRGQEG